MDETEFNVAVKKYNVKFVDYDGTVIDTQTIEEGQGAIAPKSPQRISTDKYSYEFAGWNVDFSNITSDLIVKATYDEIVKEGVKETETPKTDNANINTNTNTNIPKSGDNAFSIKALSMVAFLSAVVAVLSKKVYKNK